MTSDSNRSIVQLGLGSNLGDRRDELRGALEAIEELPETRVAAVSSTYRTEPRIVEDQPEFLNACATIETGLAPRKLLAGLQDIERRQGRRRRGDKGPRRIDLDILLWGDRVIDRDALTVPHPGLPDRAFVLVPLAEIAADAYDPRSGRTVAQLLAACEDDGTVERID